MLRWFTHCQSSNSCLLMPSFRLLEQFPKLAMAARSVRGCSFASLTALEGAGALLKICLFCPSSASSISNLSTRLTWHTMLGSGINGNSMQSFGSLNCDSMCLCCCCAFLNISIGGIFLWNFVSSVPLYFSMELSANVNGHDVLHYRWACRIYEVASGSLRPCDFRYSKLLDSLQTFRCTYNFEIR